MTQYIHFAFFLPSLPLKPSAKPRGMETRKLVPALLSSESQLGDLSLKLPYFLLGERGFFEIEKKHLPS